MGFVVCGGGSQARFTELHSTEVNVSGFKKVTRGLVSSWLQSLESVDLDQAVVVQSLSTLQWVELWPMYHLHWWVGSPKTARFYVLGFTQRSTFGCGLIPYSS